MVASLDMYELGVSGPAPDLPAGEPMVQERAGLPGSVVLDRLAQLLAAERALQAQIVQTLHLVQTQDLFAGLTGLQARSWLANVAGLPPRDADRHVRLARHLADLPAVAQAWASGRVGLGHVELLVGVLADLEEPDRQAATEILVPLATQVSPRQLARAAAQIRERTGAGEVAEARWARRMASRHLHASTTFDGLVAVDGVLDPVSGHALLQALRSAGGRSGPDDERTQAQRAADALGQIASHYLSTAQLPQSRGERPRLVITIPHAVLTGALADQTLVATPELGELPAGTLRRLACDAEAIPAVLGGQSEVLDLGRASRTWSPAQRRAITLRDGDACAHPACRNAPVDLHHIIWWSHGGPTNLANGVWLCAFHHWLVHDGGWGLERDPTTGTLAFHPRHPRGGPAPP